MVHLLNSETTQTTFALTTRWAPSVYQEPPICQSCSLSHARRVTLPLNRLIRLEEFLREDVEKNQAHVVIDWTEVDKDGNIVTRTEYDSETPTDGEGG
jgi:hypothetical protein